MSKLQAIEKDVQALSHEELAKFREWFMKHDSAAWDAQFEADARAGKLDRLAEEALEQHQRGDSKPL